MTKQKKIPRANALTLDFGYPVTVTAITINPQTNEVKFFSSGEPVKPVSAVLDKSYPGEGS